MNLGNLGHFQKTMNINSKFCLWSRNLEWLHFSSDVQVTFHTSITRPMCIPLTLCLSSIHSNDMYKIFCTENYSRAPYLPAIRTPPCTPDPQFTLDCDNEVIVFAPSIIPPFAVVARESDLPRSMIAASQTKLVCATQLKALPPSRKSVNCLKSKLFMDIHKRRTHKHCHQERIDQ